jgi:hypothetical protein
MRKQVEFWQRSDLTDVTAKVVIYEAFVEGKLEAPKHLARTVQDLNFEPKYDEFRPRPIWSLPNAFNSRNWIPFPNLRQRPNSASFWRPGSRDCSKLTVVPAGRPTLCPVLQSVS